MSTPLRALRAMLIAHAGVTATVPASRIVAGEIPQDTTWPVIALVHGSTQRHGNAAVESGAELLRSTVEVMPIVPGYAALDALVAQIESACHGQRGTFDGVLVQQCLRESIGRDEFFDEQGLWARLVVFSLIYTRT